MRAREFLFEAKPETLGQGLLDKLFKTYQTRGRDTAEFPLDNGLAVANVIYQAVGSDFLIWVSKQYNQDQHFFLHDLPTWAEDLAQFKKLAQDRRLDIVRDINRYANIAQVRAVIAQAAGTKTETNLAAKVTKLDPFVAAGQAEWRYKGNDYVIYHPKTFEASNACAHIGMTTNLCTIMNPQHFASYSRNGTLLYIITADKLFNCYVSSKRRPEYADEMNDHDYDLNYMISNFPALAKILQQEFPVEIRHRETDQIGRAHV